MFHIIYSKFVFFPPVNLFFRRILYLIPAVFIKFLHMHFEHLKYSDRINPYPANVENIVSS
jgi:hypothetical protein